MNLKHLIKYLLHPKKYMEELKRFGTIKDTPCSSHSLAFKKPCPESKNITGLRRCLFCGWLYK